MLLSYIYYIYTYNNQVNVIYKEMRFIKLMVNTWNCNITHFILNIIVFVLCSMKLLHILQSFIFIYLFRKIIIIFSIQHCRKTPL